MGIEAQETNIILNWQSSTGEIFLIESRKTLTGDTQWGELTNYFPAAANTNLTTFVDLNTMQFPTNVLGDGGGGGDISPMDLSDEPMAKPANGSGEAAPLALFPPGFDLSGLTIFDPATGENMSGNGYSVSPSSMNETQTGGLEPMDDSGDGTNAVPNTGFYRVFDVTPIARDDFFHD
ncbi:MAG: hypothetical protein ACREFE_05175 [Limisphaerales bacterium]